MLSESGKITNSEADALPDVLPWYDTEDEDVYSVDPEDGYPYDE
jgi:hypothetical protein